jgi:protein-disulfide isomerase
MKTKILNRPAAELAFYALLIAGIIICILTELEKVSPLVRELCGGENSGCSEVSASDYSKLFGVSLGIWGFFSYLILGGLYGYRKSFSVLFASAMLGAEIYFVYLQVAVIHAICRLCMANFTVVAALAVLLFVTASPEENREKFRAQGVVLIAISFLLFFIPQRLTMATQPPPDVFSKRVDSITSWGDPSSKFRLEIFSDYECPHCAKYEETVKKIMKEYPEIYIVFRDFPLSFHKVSPMAVAYAGSVAYFKGREAYFKERDEIFKHQKDIYNYLAPRYEMMRQSPEMKQAVKRKVDDDMKTARRLSIDSTPHTAIFNDGRLVKVIVGNVPFFKIKADLDKLTGRPSSVHD